MVAVAVRKGRQNEPTATMDMEIELPPKPFPRLRCPPTGRTLRPPSSDRSSVGSVRSAVAMDTRRWGRGERMQLLPGRYPGQTARTSRPGRQQEPIGEASPYLLPNDLYRDFNQTELVDLYRRRKARVEQAHQASSRDGSY